MQGRLIPTWTSCLLYYPHQSTLKPKEPLLITRFPRISLLPLLFHLFWVRSHLGTAVKDSYLCQDKWWHFKWPSQDPFACLWFIWHVIWIGSEFILLPSKIDKFGKKIPRLYSIPIKSPWSSSANVNEVPNCYKRKHDSKLSCHLHWALI